MKKEKLTIDKKMLLNTLIAIYSFNDASLDLLVNVTKTERTLVADQLDKLTSIGILTGSDVQHKIITAKRDKAKTILAEHGVIYTEVEFNEAIYRYQKIITSQNASAINNPEKVIKQPVGDMNASFDIEKNEGHRLKTKKILKYLLIINLVLGLITLLIVTMPQVVRKFKQSITADNNFTNELYQNNTTNLKSGLQNDYFHL